MRDAKIKEAVEVLENLREFTSGTPTKRLELAINFLQSYLAHSGEMPEEKEIPKPTIAELEAILDSKEKCKIEILPDGSVIGITKDSITDYGDRQYNLAHQDFILYLMKRCEEIEDMFSEIIVDGQRKNGKGYHYLMKSLFSPEELKNISQAIREHIVGGKE